MHRSSHSLLIAWTAPAVILALNRKLINVDLVPQNDINFHFSRCRKTQAVFDKCMLDNLNIERPYFGYFSEVKVHHTERPRPEGIMKPDYPDTPLPVPDDLPLEPAKFGKRAFS